MQLTENEVFGSLLSYRTLGLSKLPSGVDSSWKGEASFSAVLAADSSETFRNPIPAISFVGFV